MYHHNSYCNLYLVRLIWFMKSLFLLLFVNFLLQTSYVPHTMCSHGYSMHCGGTGKVSSKFVCPFLNNVTHKTTQLNKISVRITPRTRQHSHIKSLRHCSTLRPIQVNKTAPSQPRLIPCCSVLNARSIAKPDAFPALCADIKCNNIDVCCITETWLKPTKPSALLCPPNFSTIIERIEQTVEEEVSRSYARMIGECSYYLIWIIHSNVYGQKLLHKTLNSLLQLFTTHLTMSIMSKTLSNSYRANNYCYLNRIQI